MLQGASPQTGGFQDPKTIAAFGGATAAVFAVTATIRKVFGVNHPGVPLVLSLIVSFALAQTGDTLHGALGWVMVVVNACLLFCAVVGANEGANNVVNPPPTGRGEQQGAVPKKFLTSYFQKGPDEGGSEDKSQ